MKNFRILALSALLLTGAADPSATGEAAAVAAVQLFRAACINNMHSPDQVRFWAETHGLPVISNPASLALFVGPGGQGKAWAVPTSSGLLVLSIRGETRACAVWSKDANPGDVLSSFRRILEGVKRPGLNVLKLRDQKTPSPLGETHLLAYAVARPLASTGFFFMALTKPIEGGGVQTQLELARANLQVNGALTP